jgi:hypothetical protein
MIGRLGAAGVMPLAWRIILLFGAGAAVIGQLMLPWEQPPAMAARAPADPTELSRVSAAAPAVHPAIGEHPLFYPSRAPWVAPVAQPPAAPIAPLDHTLAGVVLTDGVRIVVLKPVSGTKNILLGEGETLNGWTLRRIDAAGAHFQAGDQTFELGFPQARSDGR